MRKDKGVGATRVELARVFVLDQRHPPDSKSGASTDSAALRLSSYGRCPPWGGDHESPSHRPNPRARPNRRLAHSRRFGHRVKAATSFYPRSLIFGGRPTPAEAVAVGHFQGKLPRPIPTRIWSVDSLFVTEADQRGAHRIDPLQFAKTRCDHRRSECDDRIKIQQSDNAFCQRSSGHSWKRLRSSYGGIFRQQFVNLFVNVLEFARERFPSKNQSRCLFTSGFHSILPSTKH